MGHGRHLTQLDPKHLSHFRQDPTGSDSFTLATPDGAKKWLS